MSSAPSASPPAEDTRPRSGRRRGCLTLLLAFWLVVLLLLFLARNGLDLTAPSGDSGSTGGGSVAGKTSPANDDAPGPASSPGSVESTPPPSPSPGPAIVAGANLSSPLWQQALADLNIDLQPCRPSSIAPTDFWQAWDASLEPIAAGASPSESPCLDALGHRDPAGLGQFLPALAGELPQPLQTSNPGCEDYAACAAACAIAADHSQPIDTLAQRQDLSAAVSSRWPETGQRPTECLEFQNSQVLESLSGSPAPQIHPDLRQLCQINAGPAAACSSTEEESPAVSCAEAIGQSGLPAADLAALLQESYITSYGDIRFDCRLALQNHILLPYIHAGLRASLLSAHQCWNQTAPCPALILPDTLSPQMLDACGASLDLPSDLPAIELIELIVTAAPWLAPEDLPAECAVLLAALTDHPANPAFWEMLTGILSAHRIDTP